MPLWDWACSAYALPGVEPICLGLQDDHGQNVCLLLWAGWAKPSDPALLTRAADIARRWDAQAVGPLRAARRALKLDAPGVTDAARLALRDDVKAAELGAERVLLESLDALGADGDADTLDALRAASSAWGISAPADALAALAAALG